MTSETSKLRALLESLPQELYDQIKDETFTAHPGTRKIGCDTKVKPCFATEPPPSLLFIDRQTRAQYAKSYYACTTIETSDLDLNKCVAWLKALPDDHRAMVSSIRVACYTLKKSDFDDICTSYLITFGKMQILHTLEKLCPADVTLDVEVGSEESGQEGAGEDMQSI